MPVPACSHLLPARPRRFSFAVCLWEMMARKRPWLVRVPGHSLRWGGEGHSLYCGAEGHSLYWGAGG